jgi:hypothetical protein
MRLASRSALGWQTGIGIEAAGGSFAEPRAGGGGTLAVMETGGHVKPRLLVGDGFARHGRISVWLQRSRPYRPAATGTQAPTTRPAPVAPAYGRATPSLRLRPPANLADGAANWVVAHQELAEDPWKASAAMGEPCSVGFPDDPGRRPGHCTDTPPLEGSPIPPSCLSPGDCR